MVQNILMIGLGSFCGGILRWLLSQFFQKFSFYQYPMGTFAVNVIGCFFIGFFYAMFEKYNIGNQSIRLFLTVGFCGSFTTFSTFINENIALLQCNNYWISLLYLCASIFIGMASLLLGISLIRNL